MLLVANPTSQSGRNALLPGEWSMVVAMGGDGTFSEVARGLYASGASPGRG